MSQHHGHSHGHSHSKDGQLEKARELLRTNADFRAAVRRDPEAALNAHGIQLSESLRQRVLSLDWNVPDEEMIQRANRTTPS